MKTKLVLTSAAFAVITAQAAVVQTGSYVLGEGSVNVPLVDSIGGHNITTFQGGGKTVSLGTASPAAGSTSSINFDNNANGGYYSRCSICLYQ